MPKPLLHSFALGSLLAAICAPVRAAGPYEASWESLSKHTDPEWFRDAQFGIYTHWGPVTVGAEDGPNGVQWCGRNMYMKSSPTFEYHRKKYGDQHEVGYKDMIAQFKAEAFDADAWAEFFAAAGARVAGQGRVRLLGSNAAPRCHINNAGQLVIAPPLLEPAERPCRHAFAFRLTGFQLALQTSNPSQR